MATVQNRSKYIVTVPKKPHLERRFPYNKLGEVKRYVEELRAQKLKPSVIQADDNIQVRVRKKGHADQILTFPSSTEAGIFLKRTEEEQGRGLFLNYTAAAKVTAAELIARYIAEECPKQKGGDNYTIMLRAMVADSQNELAKIVAKRQQEMKAFGYTITKFGANRTPMTSLEWLQKPMTEITTVEIENFISDRLEVVVASTVCRQLDLLRSVFNVAIDIWGFNVERHPMAKARRPSFFNERQRRLVGDEEVRLLDAARREDQYRSIALRREELLASDRALAAQQPSEYASKLVIKEAYPPAQQKALHSYVHVPLFETFLQFQLGTAARRGEAVGLMWHDVNFEGNTAYLPTTKNGRPRHLAVRDDILELMRSLPRTSDLIFDLNEKELRNAWERICESAGIEDLRIHDLRHEAISRAAESGLFPSVIDLKAFSGHRDLRSLSRYTHMMPGAIAKRLEAVEEKRLAAMDAKQRFRLKTTEMMHLGDPIAEVEPSAMGPSTNVISVNFRMAT